MQTTFQTNNAIGQRVLNAWRQRDLPSLALNYEMTCWNSTESPYGPTTAFLSELDTVLEGLHDLRAVEAAVFDWADTTVKRVTYLYAFIGMDQYDAALPGASSAIGSAEYVQSHLQAESGKVERVDEKLQKFSTEIRKSAKETISQLSEGSKARAILEKFAE